MGNNTREKITLERGPKPYATYFWIGMAVVAVLVVLAILAAVAERGKVESGIKAKTLATVRLPKIEIDLPVNSEATQVNFPRLRPRLSARAARAVGCNAWRMKVEKLRLVSIPRTPNQGKLKLKVRAYLPYRLTAVYIREKASGNTDNDSNQSGTNNNSGSPLTLNPGIPLDKREKMLAELREYRREIATWRMKVLVRDANGQLIRSVARAKCNEISCVFNADPLTLDISEPFKLTINFVAVPRGQGGEARLLIRSARLFIAPQTEFTRRGSFKISGNIQQIEVTGEQGSREGTIILQDAVVRQFVFPFSFLSLLPQPRRQQVTIRVSEQASQRRDQGVAWRKLMRAKQWFAAYEKVRNPGNISAAQNLLAPPQAEIVVRKMLGKNNFSVLKDIAVRAVVAQSQASD